MKRFIILVSLMLIVGTSLVFAGGSQSRTAQDGRANLVFRTWNPFLGEAWDEVMALWEAKNTGINVELLQVAFSDHFPSLRVNIASGEGPDMMGLQVGAPLVEFREFLLDVTPRAIQTWGSNWESQWFTPLMDMTRGRLGAYYGLPLGAQYAGHIWANMYFFDRYNLQLPRNFNELLEVTRVLRSHGELPLMIGARDDWINLDMFINIASDVNGQAFFDAVEGLVPFTHPDIVEALTIWRNLFDLGIFQDGALGVNMYSDTTSLFQTEQIAPMITNGAWVVNGIDTFGRGAVFEVFTMDWNNNGRPAPVAPTVDVVMSINRDSRNMEETWEFYSWFVTEGIKTYIDRSFAYLPALVDHVFDPSEFSLEMQRNLANVLEIGTTRAAFYREIPYPRLRQTLANQLKAIVIGESSPQRAAEIIEAASRDERR